MIVGDHLYCSPGTWEYEDLPFAFQWQASTSQTVWVNIAGATSFSFQVTEDQVQSFVRCAVTATNWIGSTVAYSNTLGPFLYASVGSQLGCGDYEVFVVSRGGSPTYMRVPFTSLSWERVLDDTSGASVDINGLPSGCCSQLQDIKPWVHELAIFRDGSEVWVGPIVSLEAPPDAFHIEARDLSAWWDHRLIHEDHVYSTATDLATIFTDISDDAMAPDNSPGIIIAPTATGITSIQTILASQHRMAGEALRQVADIGVDWTTIARSILCGGTTVPTAALGPLVTEHFMVPPTTRLDGQIQSNRIVVRGSGGGVAGDDIYGEASMSSSAGLLEAISTDPTVTSTTNASASATTQLATIGDDVTTVHNAFLSPQSPLTMDQLIPGSAVQIALNTCIPVSTVMRLQRVSVSVAGQSEVVGVDFMPAGTT